MESKLDHTALFKFTCVQDWLAEHRPVNGPSYANERSEECTNGLQTTQSITKGKRRLQPSELITPSIAPGDAVLVICALRALLNDIADKDRRYEVC